MLSLVDQDGTVLGRKSIIGRDLIRFTLPSIPEGTTTFRLRPEGTIAGPASPGDPRQLDFRMFRIGWAESTDIAGSDIALGTGWYQYETFAGESFRWASREAELSISTTPQVAHTLELEVAPGPSMDAAGLVLALVNDQGTVLSREPVAERRTVTFSLPPGAASQQTLKLRAEGTSSGQAAPGDPRELDFRVFKLESRPTQ